MYLFEFENFDQKGNFSFGEFKGRILSGAFRILRIFHGLQNIYLSMNSVTHCAKRSCLGSEKNLRVVRPKPFHFFQINVGKGRNRHRTTLNLNLQSILSRSRYLLFKFIVVLCRIRHFPTLISRIKWLKVWTTLRLLKISSNIENSCSAEIVSLILNFLLIIAVWHFLSNFLLKVKGMKIICVFSDWVLYHMHPSCHQIILRGDQHVKWIHVQFAVAESQVKYLDLWKYRTFVLSWFTTYYKVVV